MAKNPMGGFEIPTEMRNMAEQSVVQARQAFDGFMTAATQAMAKWTEQTAVAQAGARDAGERIMGFAEKNMTTSFEFAQRVVRAKDVEEMMRIQADFVRSQMDVLKNQAEEIGQTVTQAAKDAQGKTPR